MTFVDPVVGNMTGMDWYWLMIIFFGLIALVLLIAFLQGSRSTGSVVVRRDEERE